MQIEQVVQVEIMGAFRPYTYAWTFDPTKGEVPLDVGDRVELPPNEVQEEGSSGTVVRQGSDYSGPMKKIVRKIEPDTSSPDDDLWAGWDQDDRYA